MEDEGGEPLRQLVRKYDEKECVHVESEGKERKLVLLKAVKPSEVILHIPAKALLNAKTVSQYLPQDILPSANNSAHSSNWKDSSLDVNEARLPLTSVQALTLLLAAWRSLRRDAKTQAKSDLDEILLTLPASYSTFPLTWKVSLEQTEGAQYDDLASYYKSSLDALPNHVSTLCEQVYQRFIKDCAAIQSVERNTPELYTFQDVKIGHLKQSDLLWAWCSVNSRCIYLPLGLKHSKENFTLAPLLDMANHTMEPHLECKVKWTNANGLQLSAPAKTYGPQGLAKGQEVMIAYGAHSNGTLLSEYGFTLCHTQKDYLQDSKWIGNPFAEVNIDDIIYRHLTNDEQYGTQKEQMLREAGYYGDYTIHPYPQPAHVSFRLIVVLRLLAIVNWAVGEDIKAWHQTISGQREEVSSQNEFAARKLLKEICDQVIEDRRRRQERLDTIANTIPSISKYTIDLQDLHFNFSMIQKLLDEEAHIARLMRNAVEEGLPIN